MTGKASIIIGCTVLAVVALLVVRVWRIVTIFDGNPKVEVACNDKVLESLIIQNAIATTITIEEDICDHGFIVSGAFKVILRYADGGRIIERPLLVQGSLGSEVRRPSVSVVNRSNVVIVGQRDLVVGLGPKEAAGIQFTYKLE